MGLKTYRSDETRKWPSRAGNSPSPERNPCLIRPLPSQSRQMRQGLPATPHCLLTEPRSSSQGQSASTQQQYLASCPAYHVLGSKLKYSTTGLVLDLMLALATSDFACLTGLVTVTYSFDTAYVRIVTDLSNCTILTDSYNTSFPQSCTLQNSVCQILWK